MIKLEVQDYCQTCPNFEADVERPVTLYRDAEEITIGDTIIRCENRRICERVKKVISNEKE